MDSTDNVDSVAAQVEALAISANITPRTLLGMPKEIQQRIFELLLEEENPTLGITIAQDLVDGEYSGRVSKEIEYATPWIPQLRLVSSSINALASPIIAARASIRFTRGSSKRNWEERLPLLHLARYVPGYLLARVRTIAILEHNAYYYMRPLDAVDASGFPKLEYVELGPYDPAYTMVSVLAEMEDDTTRVKIARVLNIIQRLAPGHNALFLALNVGIYGSPDQVLRRFFKATLLPMFEGRLKDYADLMRIMRAKVWELQHDSVQGLTSTTRLALCIKDLASRTDTARYERVGYGPARLGIKNETWGEHKNNELLEVLRV
ncbi:uncharacterized protein AB675_12035 [Cyphellophora attinorum]|uniref:F-box domain-containing protein n=1 Tax=Cyphellophora attinorum TaxID=1664694 RepID=A0A0N0NKP6_9EURO|nr:uncharacterized protein AB675_12035 [Phialophora attinorum]KPI38278.1 hypothetical protein AB675_12035 [Phialophora attinorum]